MVKQQQLIIVVHAINVTVVNNTHIIQSEPRVTRSNSDLSNILIVANATYRTIVMQLRHYWQTQLLRRNLTAIW